MNIFLWILQFLLAFHTITGAIWKFSNSVMTLPIPRELWLGLSIVEIAASFALIAPLFNKKWGKWPAYAAAFVASEMVVYSALNYFSQFKDMGSIQYWLVVAAISGFIAYARLVLKPIATK